MDSLVGCFTNEDITESNPFYYAQDMLAGYTSPSRPKKSQSLKSIKQKRKEVKYNSSFVNQNGISNGRRVIKIIISDIENGTKCKKTPDISVQYIVTSNHDDLLEMTENLLIIVIMALASLDPGPGAAALQAWGGQVAAYGAANQTVVDKVMPDILHLVDPHWYQFPPMNPLWHGLLGFTIGVLGFVSIVGNGMVVYIFTTTKSLKTPSNLLVVNLAFSDFLMMCCMSPAMVINCYNETWVFGPLACELYACAGSLFGCASIWTMTMIAFDRYNVIVKGIAAKPMNTNGALMRILGIWIFALGWTLAPFFGWNRYVPEGNMTACGTDYLTKDWFHRSYILVYSVFVYFMPLFLIIYSYFFIIQAVSAHEKAMREQAKKMNVASLRSSEAANTSAECKLAKVALMTISLWFMAWTPYLVINYTGVFEGAPLTPLATIWGSLFAKANAVYNPIVYGISHPRYRAALYQRFPSLSCQASPEQTESTASVTTAASEEKPAA